MLWWIIIILLALWALGLIGHVLGGLIHILLIIALVVFIVKMIQKTRD